MEWMRKNSQSGSVLVYVAILLIPVLLPFVALAIDFGLAYQHKSRLQNIADAAALAGVVAGGKADIEEEQEANPSVEMPKPMRGRLIQPPSGDGVTSLNPEKANKAAEYYLRENSRTKEYPGGAWSLEGKKVEGGGTQNPPDTQLLKEDASEEATSNSKYYYMVKLVEQVPFAIAKHIPFLDYFMPGGWTVSAVAWASVGGAGDPGPDLRHGPSMLEQLETVEQGQTYSSFQDIAEQLGSSDKARARRDGSVGIYYTYENGRAVRKEYFHLGREMDSESRENPGVTDDGNRLDNKSKKDKWLENTRDLFIDFKPDVATRTALGNWDVGDSAPSNLQYSNLRFNGMADNWRYANKSQKDVIRALMENLSITEAEARDLLSTRIEEIINIDDDFAKYQLLYGTRNTRTAPTGTVATNAYGEISEEDPLLVRIESEELNAVSGSTFYTNSVRDITINIKLDNLNPKNADGSYTYRPIAFFYEGPIVEGSDAGNRVTQKLTLNLEEDFRGMIYAPNSTVEINGNGHKMQGLVIAKEVAGVRMPETSGSSTFDTNDREATRKFMERHSDEYEDLYRSVGLSSATYDSFGLVKLINYTDLGSDILFSTERARVID